MNKPTLSDLTAFLTVARHRSFRAAAEELRVSRSSLSHAIRGLEKQLDARLLHRTTRSVAPTEVGRRLLERMTPALSELDNALAEVAEHAAGIVGTLRINATQSAGRWLVRHVIPSFMRLYPQVTVDIVSDNRFVDIVADGFDAGVRLHEDVPQDMIAVAFGGPFRFIAVAAPSYITQHGRPAAPQDLLAHRCIRRRLASGKPYAWEFSKDQEDVAIDVHGALTLNDNLTLVEAAIDALGIAYVPELYAAAALCDGRLDVLLPEWSPQLPGYCLYYPGHRHVPPALRSFVAHLRQLDSSTSHSWL